MDNKLKTVDAETLLSTPMSKTMFIVDGLISQGVNVISGASKIGKSWLMLWLGLQVAQGNSIWGLPTLQCDVLYLSLEDTQRRIKDQLYNLTDSAPDNLYFAVTSGLIGGGLEEQITDFLTEHPATKLVIIDTLQKVRDSKGSAGKAGMYGNDYDDISSIKHIADGFNIAILLVHSRNSWRATACAGCAFTICVTAVPACCWPTACLSSTFRSGWATAISPPRRTSTPTWITSLKSPRHRRWRQGLLYRRAATSKAGGDRLMLGRTDDFLSEKVKEHGTARFGKRKEPVIGLITGS